MAPRAVAVAAAIRMLAKLKPDGAAETSAPFFLPSAAEETLAEEVRLALAEMAAGDAQSGFRVGGRADG